MAASQRICSIPDCGKPVLARGLCALHYNRTRKDRSGKCSVEGCDQPITGHGLCFAHARRFRLYGDPLTVKKPANGACEQWLRDHIGYQGDDCLIWPFARETTGYGKFLRNRRKVYASRAMCELAHGAPPSDKHEAAHSCGNGHLGCTNPKHLRWDTKTGNAADKLVHGTDSRGEKNVNAKLTEDAVRYIRSMRGRCLQRELAEIFGVDTSTIGKVQRREWWSWFE